MRSVAVLFVVTYHVLMFFSVISATSPLRELGHWGVMMFFVHTSFVLVLSLERHQARGRERGLFAPFMVRRIFRIAPLATLVAVAIVLWKLPLAHMQNGQFRGMPLTLSDVLANLLFVQNLASMDSLEAPMWSLPYEMQMYLVLPLLYLFVRRVSTAAVLLGCWLAVAVICRVGLRFDDRGPFIMLEYVPCFMAGVGAYGLLRTPHRKWRFAVWPITLLVCAVCYCSRPTFAMSWGCCLALGIALVSCADMAPGIMSRICHLIARYSYGIYLTHFICIWLAFVLLGYLPWPVRVLVFAIALVVLPLGLYHLVEAPMIKWGSRLTRATPFRGDAVLQ